MAPTEMTAVLAINPAGSFVLQATSRDEMMRADFDISGSWSLMVVRESDWRIAAFRVGLDDRTSVLRLDVRTARSFDDGSIEGRAHTRIRGRRRRTRTIRIERDGSWNSGYRDVRRGGGKIVGEASADANGDGASVISRRRLDANGRELWSLSADTQIRHRRNNQSGAEPVRILTVSTVDYAQGGHGTSRVLSSTDSGDRKEKSQWRPVPSAAGTSATETKTRRPDGSDVTTRITKIDGGGVKYETTVESPSRTTSDGRNVWDTTVNTAEISSSGARTTSEEHRRLESSGHQHGLTEIWEKTTTDTNGVTTKERGVHRVGADTPNGTESITVITYHADGSMTITTETFDATTGHGLRRRTVYDRNGAIVSDESTDDSDPDTDEDAGANTDDDDDDDGDDDGDDDDGDNDSDDTDDDADDGDDGGGAGDDGMGWDGGDEGPPAVLPKPKSFADIVNDPLGLTDDEFDDDPLATRLGQALKNGALVVPNAPDTGWGEATGSETPPDLKLIPSGALFVNVDTPTEDWGDWNDPRVHVAYAEHLLEAATHSGQTDLGAVTSAARAVRQTAVFAKLTYGSGS